MLRHRNPLAKDFRKRVSHPLIRYTHTRIGVNVYLSRSRSCANQISDRVLAGRAVVMGAMVPRGRSPESRIGSVAATDQSQ